MLNTDVEVDPQWLVYLVRTAGEDTKTAAVGARVIPMRSRGLDIEPYRFSKVQEVAVAPGAAMLVKRDVIDRIGFFDQDYFLYYEEYDFCWRLLLSGYKIYINPLAIVYHYAEGTRRIYTLIKSKNKEDWLVKDGQLKNILSYVYRNQIVLYIKVLERIHALVFLLFPIPRFLWDGVLKRNRFTSASMILSWRWIYKNRSQIFEKRRQVQRTRLEGDSRLMRLFLRQRAEWRNIDKFYRHVEEQAISSPS